MQSVEQFLFQLKDWIWGIPLLVFLLGTGIYLTVVLKGMQFRYLGYALTQIFIPQKKESEGDISPFEALMTSLAGAIGTGTVVGVTTAVTIGGFGALFWMWITAFFGMATKYAESLLAVKYRKMDANGEMLGGPMEYMERGLGWKWMALLFAFFGSVAAIGTGNLVQANAIVEAAQYMLPVDSLWIAIGLAITLGLVLLGGVKSIGKVAGILVPVMALFYFFGGLTIIGINYDSVPSAFALIFREAFSPTAAMGGVAGGGILLVIQMGVSRSVFSNEAGMGISSISAAAAKTDSPGRQAMITMTGALISTVIMCTITGLVLAVSGVVGLKSATGEAITGASLTIHAFNSVVPGFGLIVSVGLILFAFSTLIAWAYYGEKCCEYLLGEKVIKYYRTFFVFVVIPGAMMKLEMVWFLADSINGLMVIPNLFALLLLKNVIVDETNLFLEQIKLDSIKEVA
ncbi:sodium:alanine symporter family protein [Chlamydiales bacterium]|nr:sodium:alanine symporter family protein [Chlamydiales bacterium]